MLTPSPIETATSLKTNSWQPKLPGKSPINQLGEKKVKRCRKPWFSPSLVVVFHGFPVNRPLNQFGDIPEVLEFYYH
jgi:hypothetical protein